MLLGTTPRSRVHELLPEDNDTSSATLAALQEGHHHADDTRSAGTSLVMDIYDVPSPLEHLRANADAETGMTT